MIGMHISQFCHTLHNICQMPELVFQGLWCHIGSSGKHTECRNIGEIITLIKESQIATDHASIDNDLCSLFHIGRNMKT